MHKKTAIILLNLGGPGDLKSVRGFLFNLFFDENIIRLKKPLRFLIAYLIAKKRDKFAQEVYKKIGGKSPILENTQKQAQALQNYLEKNQGKDTEYKVFVSMRYSAPRAFEVIDQLKKESFSEIILLPLYPQFSSTTTFSSFNEWKKLAEKKGLNSKTKFVCCYFDHEDFIKAHVEKIEKYLNKFASRKDFRILFSAHGLPKKISDSGDPYKTQIEENVAKIVEKIGLADLDYSICYQSRVGPLEWISPSTDNEIKRAAADKKSIILVPIAFVSEHSETLVELDIEYKDLAEHLGIKEYLRVPALGEDENYIKTLADLVEKTSKNEDIFSKQRACCKNSPYCPALNFK